MTIQCCICRKVSDDSVWVEPTAKPEDKVSHTYCPRCLNDTLREYRQDWGHPDTIQPLTQEAV